MITPAPISTEAVDIYRIRLDQPDPEVARHAAWLSADELARAARFLTADKAREFIITRASLRRILAQILDEDPVRIRISRGPQGKPSLDSAADADGLSFSVSHSHDLALIAVTLDRNIGIDVERIRTDIDHASLSRRFFSPAEHEALQSCSEAERLRAFYSVWTRKEAVVKAQGEGIALGLKQFDVSVDPDSPPCILATRWQQPGIPDWTLINIDAGPDYAACLAVSGEDITINYR